MSDLRGLAIYDSASEGDATLEIVVPLGPEEFAVALEAAQGIQRTLRPQTMDLVRSSYDALTSTLSFHSHLTESHAVRSSSALQFGMPGLGSLLFGWLSTCRLFLDHSGKALSDYFGKTSAERQRFAEATKWAYDHSLGYRFTYKLRNAFQHVGMPAVSASVWRNEETGKNELAIVGNRDELLDSYDSWGPVAQDLAELPEEFDLVPLVGAAMVQYEFLAGQFRDVFRRDTLAKMCVVEPLLARVSERGGESMLVDSTPIGADRRRWSTMPLRNADVDAVKRLPPYPSGQPSTHACIGDIRDGSTCSRLASALVTAPHATGVALMPACDLHHHALGRWSVKQLGAAQLVHISVAEYIRRGLSAAGHVATSIVDAETATDLRKTNTPLPSLNLPLSQSGWMVSTDPELQRRTDRAVRTMITWLSEGGGTGRFFESINEIIAEDGDVAPLLVGLVNLNGMFVSMVSSILGKTPEMVLGGITDDLMEFDDRQQSSPPGTYFMPERNALVVKLVPGESSPMELRGGSTTFPSGLEAAFSLDEEGRLYLAVILAASDWLNPEVLQNFGASLGVWAVEDELDTVFIEIAAGRAGETVSTDGVRVEDFEIQAAYDSNRRLAGFIVPNASRSLPPPFDQVGGGT